VTDRLAPPPASRHTEHLPDHAAVDRALGLLLGQRGYPTDEAQRLLARSARREGREIAEVARDLLAGATGRESQVGVALTYTELGRALADDGGDAAVRRVAAMAVERVPGADRASIVLQRHGAIITVAATDDLAEATDRLQDKLGEGPCLTALAGPGASLANDLATERRWPAFAARADAELDVRAVLSLRLCIDVDDLETTGAGLNIYSTTRGGYTPDSVVVGTLLAAHASTALVASHNRHHREHLEEALRTNREIGMAIGILMDQRKATRDAAFNLLRTASQRSNRKLRSIAAEVVETGTLAETP
jgi:AmiR/NasT family two-component response regulator